MLHVRGKGSLSKLNPYSAHTPSFSKTRKTLLAFFRVLCFRPAKNIDGLPAFASSQVAPLPHGNQGS